MDEKGHIVLLLLKEFQPTYLAGISLSKHELGNMNAKTFNNDIKEMLGHMESLYKEIIENNQKQNGVILHIHWVL